MRDKHWDPKLNGVDWQAVHDELRPKIEKAATMDEARAVMSDMVRRLKQTHFGIVAGEAYKELDQEDDDGKATPLEGDPGLDLRMRGWPRPGDLRDPGFARRRQRREAGLGNSAHRQARIWRPRWPKSARQLGSPMLDELVETRSVLARLEGPIEKTVEVEFLDGDGRKVTLKTGAHRPARRRDRRGHAAAAAFLGGCPQDPTRILAMCNSTCSSSRKR